MFAALILASLAAANAGLYTDNRQALQTMFNQFKVDFGKTYTAADESIRFANFVQTLKMIDERNKAENGTAVHGITKFSDMSHDEFATKYLSSKTNNFNENTPVKTITSAPVGAGLVDWTGKYTTAVKDQGYCGSCWAFSATEQIESDAIRTLGTTILLSAEQITQCDGTSFGCGGGWTEHAYNYVKKAGGIEAESDYPYTSYQGVTGQCHSDSSKYKIKVNSYTTINGESQMASYVEDTGPLSVCVDASTWSSYKGGIMTACGQSVNHCVQAVGVYATSGGYWKVRNSWSDTWGEDGHIRLAYGKNTCAITSDPTYVSVSTA